MAKLNFDDIQGQFQANGQHSNVGFFSLKNDGDKALVRVMYTDPSEFEIFREHQVTNKDGKIRAVNCLRDNDAADPISKCPFCEANIPRRDRFYLKLLQYTQDVNGNVVVEAKVWDRPVTFAKRLASKMGEYGPLTDCLVYIKRLGAPRDKNTTYEIDYAVVENRTPEKYPIKPELFEGYETFGYRVLNKSAEDMVAFLTSGEFPRKVKDSQQESSIAPASESVNSASLGFQPDVNIQPQFNTAPAQPTQAPNGFSAPTFAPQFNQTPAQPPFTPSQPQQGTQTPFTAQAPFTRTY